MNASRLAHLQRRIEQTLGVPAVGPIRTTIYANSGKDSMYEKGEELGLKGDALSAFAYTASEVEIEVRVDRESGRCLAETINGVAISSGEALGGIPV